MRSDSHAGRSYAPIGETPVRLVSGSRFSTNMISTVTNRGKLRFMLYRETLTAPVLIRFLSRLIRDAQGRKVFLILDRSEEHTSELQSLMRISYAVFCLKKTKHKQLHRLNTQYNV